MKEIDAVGHRVVHGGEKFAKSVVITDEVMAGHRGVHPPGPAPQPRQHHRHQGLPGASCPACPWWPCSTPPSTRPCPPRPTSMPCPMSTMRRTRSAATASTAPLTSYVSQRAADMLGKPIEELKLDLLPPGQRLLRHRRSTAARAWTPPWASPRWPVFPWAPAPATWTPASCEYLMNKYGMDINEMLTILNKKSGVHGRLRRQLRLPRSRRGRRARATSAPAWPSICSTTA